MDGLNTIDDIPPWWRNVLTEAQAVAPSAVLAGGALRDRALARRVKDLDIFIKADSAREAEAVMAELEGAGFRVKYEPSELTCYPEDQNLEVVCVADVEGFALPVQLIFTTWPTDRIVERFDYGVCRIAFDGQKIIRPPEFDEDAAAKVFRLRRDRPTPVSLRGSIHRFARLTNDKYAGWTWRPFERPEDAFDGLVWSA